MALTVLSNVLELAGAALVVAGLWIVHPAAALVAGGAVVFLLGSKTGRA